jgi:hypothetical protein
MRDEEFWERLIRLLLSIVYLMARWKGVPIKRKDEEK